jgi:hypothetical protein
MPTAIPSEYLEGSGGFSLLDMEHWVGASPLVGSSLVFPILMLMTAISNGGKGSGVTSSVARLIGVGKSQDSDLAPEKRIPC